MTRIRATVVLACLLLLSVLSACGANSERDASQQPQGAALRITLGTQAFPEARLLGELWRQALAANGYTVDLRKAVGPAEDLDKALRGGQIDGYVAYTGTVLSIVAGEEVSGLDPAQTYERVRDYYATQGMAVSETTPFENKDVVATTNAYATQHRLTSIADLQSAGRVVFGARPEFEHLHLGLEGLRSVYGLKNLQFTPIELGKQYDALDNGSAQAVNAFSTDPQMRTGKYTLLNDPKRLFGSQNVVMVVSKDKLSRIDANAFLHVVNTVNAALTENAMVDMNAQVTQGRNDSDVARAFLRSAGLLDRLPAS